MLARPLVYAVTCADGDIHDEGEGRLTVFHGGALADAAVRVLASCGCGPHRAVVLIDREQGGPPLRDALAALAERTGNTLAMLAGTEWAAVPTWSTTVAALDRARQVLAEHDLRAGSRTFADAELRASQSLASRVLLRSGEPELADCGGCGVAHARDELEPRFGRGIGEGAFCEACLDRASRP